MVNKTDSPVVIRSLAPSESFFVPIGMYAGYVVQVRGSLDLDALSSALASTRHAHPVLATHLESTGDTHLLIKSADPLPGIKVHPGDIRNPLAGFEVDPSRALSVVHVVRDGDRATVALLVHHAIADGHYILSVLDSLWSSYSEIVAGRQPTLAIHDYPDAIEKILSDRGIGQFNYQSPPTTPIPGSSTKISRIDLPGYASTLLRCRLDKKHTAALVEFGHRMQLTVNALVSAAIIRAEAEARKVPLSKIPYFTIADLRQRLSPPVATTAGTNVISLVRFTADEADELGLVQLARAVSRRLPEELEEGTARYETAMQIKDFVDSLSAPLAPQSVMTTNVGSVPTPRFPKSLEIDDFYIAVYNKIQDVTISSPAQSESNQTYFIYSFQGELSIQFLVTDAIHSDSAQKKLESLKRILHALPMSQS
jgi:phenolphthiocerol/phthiocerol/phthiodiolone dimycocerosyl transferase